MAPFSESGEKQQNRAECFPFPVVQGSNSRQRDGGLMRAPTLALFLLAPLMGCSEGDPPLTGEELREAFEAVLVSNAGSALTGEAVEISTSFTLGQAWEEAVQNTRDFYESQIPCSTVSVDARTVTIDFGELADACTYDGRTYAGLQSMTIEGIDAGVAELSHNFTGFTNGTVTLDGDASVTWDFAAGTRTVSHDGVWTQSGGEALVTAGDRTQQLVDPDVGFTAGIQIDGERTWTWKEHDWTLDIDNVEMRPADPVPQAGAYVLTTPSDKTLTLMFERLDEDTIQVIVEGGRETQTFNITATGLVTEPEA
jgi:hypothetical protein